MFKRVILTPLSEDLSQSEQLFETKPPLAKIKKHPFFLHLSLYYVCTTLLPSSGSVSQSSSQQASAVSPRRAARGRYNRATAAAEGVSSFSWPPFEAAYFFSEFTVRASTPLLQLLVLVSRASWQLAEAQPAVHCCRRRSRPTGL